MGFKIVGTLHILVVSDRDPSPNDWTEYMRALQAEERKGVDVSEWRSLVFSDGGGPNASQRKAVSDLLKGRSSPLAIVSGNALMRGVITALRWFNPLCRAYAPHEVGEALKFLNVPLLKFDSIKQNALEIQRSLGLRQVRALEESRLTGGTVTSARV
jgi:hypothetical protein